MARKIEYELLTIENNNIVVEQAVIDRIKMFKELKEKIDELDAQLKEELEFAMRECGVKKYSNDVFTVTYIEPSSRRYVDTEKLKADGLYEEYSYTVPTSSFVKLKMK